MRTEPYLRPTATQRIRTFFDETGETVPPWTTLDDVMDRLWTVLHARRRDPGFWSALERLVSTLGDDLSGRRAGALPAPGAEILEKDRIRGILEDLRGALDRPQPAAAPGCMRRFSRTLGAPALGCILLLGAALSACCKSDRSTTAPTTLERYVDESTVPPADKAALRACFAGLDGAEKNELVALFRDRAPEEIAARLEEMLEPGGACGPAPVAVDAGGAVETPVRPPPPPPDVRPVYKGVAF